MKPNGRLYLMVYATYGRAGIYMLQELCRLVGIEANDEELSELRWLIDATPTNHPIHIFRTATNDLNSLNGVADALLHPSDRSYSVPQLFRWLEACGVRFERWLFQAPYLPRFSAVEKLRKVESRGLKGVDAYASMELFRGTMITHRFVAARDDDPFSVSNLLENEDWKSLKPVLFPGARVNTSAVPKGCAAQLWHPVHGYADLVQNINSVELDMLKVVDGERTLADVATLSGVDDQTVRHSFAMLWDLDQILFRL